MLFFRLQIYGDYEKEDVIQKLQEQVMERERERGEEGERVLN